MKKNMIFSSLVLPIIPVSFIAAKSGIENENINFILESELLTVNKITNSKNKIKLSKEIFDLSGKRYLFIAFDDCNSIVDIENLLTVEINFNKYKLDLIKNNKIYFLGKSALLYESSEENAFINLMDNTIVDKDSIKYENILDLGDLSEKELRIKNLNKRKEIISKKGSFKTLDDPKKYESALWRTNRSLNVSTQVPYSWWFATRDSKNSSGYDQLGNEGLCEYVALSQLLLYTDLFINPNIFNYEQYKKYIKESNSNNLYYSSPEFKYHYYNSDNKSLAYDLFNLGGKNLNLKTANVYEEITKKFISNKNTLNEINFTNKFGGYYKAWELVKKGIPSILGVATLSGFYHAMIIYGYDDDTDMFLSSYCWGDSRTNKVLYSYYTKVWGSYCFSIEQKQKSDFVFRKSFIYGNEEYTGIEIDEILRDRSEYE